MCGGIQYAENTPLTYFPDVGTQPSANRAKQQSPFSFECHLLQRSRAAFTDSPGGLFWKLRNKGALECCVSSVAERPHPQHVWPPVNSPGRTFIDCGAVAGEHIIDTFPDKGDGVSLWLAWGFNYMIKLQLLPLETNCILRLIVFYESHTGSKILLSWSWSDLMVMPYHLLHSFQKREVFWSCGWGGQAPGGPSGLLCISVYSRGRPALSDGLKAHFIYFLLQKRALWVPDRKIGKRHKKYVWRTIQLIHNVQFY